MFNLVSKFTPSGDQPEAIEKLVNGIKNGGSGFRILNKFPLIYERDYIIEYKVKCDF